jgi:copper chaperone CopZ
MVKFAHGTLQQLGYDYIDRSINISARRFPSMDESNNCHVEPLHKPLDQERVSSAKAVYLAIWGMGCPTCANRVRNGLLSLPGVLTAEVELEQALAAAAYDPESVTVNDLLQAVSAAGNDGRHDYQAKLIQEIPVNQAAHLLSRRNRPLSAI